jgi:hypothetical protein
MSTLLLHDRDHEAPLAQAKDEPRFLTVEARAPAAGTVNAPCESDWKAMPTEARATGFRGSAA